MIFSKYAPALVAAMAATTFAANEEVFHKTRLLVAQTAASHKHLLHRSMQTSTEQCNADAEAFYDANPALEAALEDWDDDYDAAYSASCGDENALVCTLNEDTFPSTPVFAAACTDAGGNIFEYDYVIQCTATVDGESVTARHTMLNVDECFPPSDACDPEEIGQEIESEVNVALDELEALLEELETGLSVNCEFGLSVSNQAGQVILRSGSVNLSSNGSAAPELFAPRTPALLAGMVLLGGAFAVL